MSEFDQFIKSLPKDIRNHLNLPLERMVPNSHSWREAGLTGPDFPHSWPHASKVAQTAIILGSHLKLEEKQVKRIVAFSYYHDWGQAFARVGLCSYDNHHLASKLYVQKVFQDASLTKEDIVQVNKAIHLHPRDVLPQNTPLWIRVCRDADRIAGIGWGGVVRIAYYLGFRHPLMETDPYNFDLDGDGILFDSRPPWSVGYEVKVKEFCMKEILFYILRQKLAKRAIDQCTILEQRFYGARDKRGALSIEPVMPLAQELFLSNMMSTQLFALEVFQADLAQNNTR